jgi:hypothetical protein
MDVAEEIQPLEDAPLSYNEDTTYEEQVAASEGPSLVDRISRNKVYLLSESTTSRTAKVRETQNYYFE